MVRSDSPVRSCTTWISKAMVPTCWIPIRDGVAAAKERCDEVV
jgi:hypothetical protein